jgi:hypothetical protein
MAKQTFTTGQVLTAAQMTSLQQTAMLGGAASAKTASYTLVAADAGTAISMSNASATTITVNTSLFAAGDTIQITNIGAGVCTITAGTATVNTSATLALAQYESGTLYFTSTSASIFIKAAGAAAGGGGKVLQVVSATTTTQTAITSTTMTDSGLSITITPTLASSKVMILVSQQVQVERNNTAQSAGWRLLRGATQIFDGDGTLSRGFLIVTNNQTEIAYAQFASIVYLDSPATTSATTYKTQGKVEVTTNNSTIRFQHNSCMSSIIALEIGA